MNEHKPHFSVLSVFVIRIWKQQWESSEGLADHVTHKHTFAVFAA